MPTSVDRDGWKLRDSEERDLEQLMDWFTDAQSVNVWGGPKFRYPFTAATFREDCHWGRMATFVLESPAGRFAAFGQVYKRYERINFARLIVDPELRGEGVGKRLVDRLMKIGPEVVDRSEFSLFVYRHNTAALECYLSAGFRIRDYPEDVSMGDECYYLTRPVTDSDNNKSEGGSQ